jgi:hypothetical protein
MEYRIDERRGELPWDTFFFDENGDTKRKSSLHKNE